MKRFTETGKWEKAWFQELAPHLKCLWLYMCDKADSAGVWEINWKAASFFIGKTVSEADLKHFAGRIAVFGAKLVIGSFIEFQYGRLSEDCRAHLPIFRTIEKHRVSIGYSKAMDSLKEKEEEKEEEKEPEEEGPKPTELPLAVTRKDRGTREDIRGFCVESALPSSDGDWFFDKCEGNGWRVGGSAIKCWRSTIRQWKQQGYMPSQKRSGSNGGIRENIKPKIITIGGET